MKRRMSIGAVAMVLSTLLAGAGNAHTGWKLEGKLSLSTFYPSFGAGCLLHPECAAFLATCAAVQAWDGRDLNMSYRVLPSRTASHRAKFTWDADSGPIGLDGGPGQVAVYFKPDAVGISGVPQAGQVPTCEGAGQFGASRFSAAKSFDVTVPPGVKWVMVGAFMAQNFEWKLEGIAH